MADFKKDKVVDIKDLSMEELKAQYNVTSNKIKELDKKIEEIERKNKEKNKGKIPLAELVVNTIKFMRGDITQEEFGEFGKTINIRPYIPMNEKLKLVSTIIFKLDNLESNGYHEIKIINMEKDLFFEVLLGGYAMIDVSDNNLKTYDNMDILYPIFSSFILQYCSLDYNMIKDIIKESLSIYHLEDMNKILSGVNYKKIEEATKENERIIQELQKSKELVKTLKDISVNVSPGAEILNKMLQNDAKYELKTGDIVNLTEKEKEEVKKEKEEVVEEDTNKESVKENNKEVSLKNNLNSTSNETGKKRRGRPKKSSNKK